MGKLIVVNGATLKCDQAMPGPPNQLVVLPLGAKITVDGNAAATIADMKPMVNLMPFSPGCKSTSHPAAQAKPPPPPPYPCTPTPGGMWSPGSDKLQSGALKVITEAAECQCVLAAGTLTIDDPGQEKLEVP